MQQRLMYDESMALSMRKLISSLPGRISHVFIERLPCDKLEDDGAKRKYVKQLFKANFFTTTVIKRVKIFMIVIKFRGPRVPCFRWFCREILHRVAVVERGNVRVLARSEED